VPLPARTDVADVTLYEPDKAPKRARWGVADGFVTIRVPNFWIYTVFRASVTSQRKSRLPLSPNAKSAEAAPVEEDEGPRAAADDRDERSQTAFTATAVSSWS
jgi:hypothetical protein